MYIRQQPDLFDQHAKGSRGFVRAAEYFKSYPRHGA